MMNKQGVGGIPYCDYTWNPVTGCLHGCSYCFAERIAKRFNGSAAFPNGFLPRFHEGRLGEPERIKKPSRIFVSDMGDLFGDWVPDQWITLVLCVALNNPQHTFLFLTKNPKRYKEFNFPDNAWLGTSVEDQAAADERIPLLLQATAKVRFISAEPLLGPLDLSYYLPRKPIKECPQKMLPYYNIHGIDWLIVGGETGPGARPVHPDWVRSLRDQCQSVGVPYFFKQWGAWTAEYPTNLVFPHAAQPFKRGEFFYRVGKMKAGRLIDGQTWDELPEIGRHDE